MKIFKNQFIHHLWILFVAGSLLLAACGGAPAENNPPVSNGTQTPLPTSTATAIPKKTLVICEADEPQSLYLYGGSSASTWSVLESIYDGPIDTVDFKPQPVLLTEIPSLENGGVSIGTVAVAGGDVVANTEGDLVSLQKGVKVFPGGCTDASCAVEWDGQSALTVSQMTVTFKLKSGVKWSDGQSLSAQDSVFSFTAAGSAITQSSKTLVNKTESYTAVDSQTIQWTGKPGYLTLNPSAFFWIPLPSHQLSLLSPEEMTTSSLTNKTPLGWGAYKIDEWIPGDHIRMVKNPYYFRADEGYPKFDVIVYRFLGSAATTDLAPLSNGECDVMDTSLQMVDQLKALDALHTQGKVNLFLGQGPEWEVLNFGIKPASYDEVYNPFIDRQDFFGDSRVRQAIAYCTDRSSINSALFQGKANIPDSYLPPSHPSLGSGLTHYDYDPEQGKKLLEEAGWKDNDGDPSTPRVSLGVRNILDGTKFEVSYTASESDWHSQIATILTSDLGACGIQLTTNLLPVADLYAQGPDGILFGRNFDLAEIAWSGGSLPPCYLYASSEIPAGKNQWLGSKFGGVNITGYSNPEYDQACQAMLSAGLSADNFEAANQKTQEILSRELPMLPLFDHLKILAAKAEVCGLSLDVSSRSALKDLELLDLGNTCVN